MWHLWLFSNARPIQKGTKSNGVYLSLVHRKKLVEDTLEFRKAKKFCFQHSKFDAKRQERVFAGTPKDVAAFVKIAVPDAHLADLPDTPQGLVLADNRCRGAFQ
jgi:hypothetical protein